MVLAEAVGRSALFAKIALLVLLAPGCNRTPPGSMNDASKTASGKQPLLRPATQDEYVSSWQQQSSRIRANCEAWATAEREQKARQGLQDSRITVEVHADLRKSDSVISPYVGIVTIEVLNSWVGETDTVSRRFNVEYENDDGEWVARKGSCDTVNMTLGKNEKTTEQLWGDKLNSRQSIIGKMLHWGDAER